MEKEKLSNPKIEKSISGIVEQTKSYSQSLLVIGTQCLINKN